MPELTPTPPVTPLRNATIPLDYTHRGPFRPFSARVLDVLKTMGWVAPLTVLIWIYAERQQTESMVTQIPIDISINAPDRMVIVKDPPDRTVVATLNGPRNGVQRVDDALKAHERIQLTLVGKISSGEQPIANTASLISASPLFLQNGVSVRDITPRFLRVQVDDIKEQLLPVTYAGDVKNLSGAPQFLPERVKVRAPDSVLKLAASQNKLQVVADLSKAE